MILKSTVQDIRGIFSSTKYRVPEFQRPYKWTDEEIGQFLYDIKTAQKSKEDYFVGQIMWYFNQEKNNIIDGQQRITTIFLIMGVLYKEIQEKYDWMFSGKEDEISFKIDCRNTIDDLKISLGIKEIVVNEKLKWH